MFRRLRDGIAGRIAPPRFLLFLGAWAALMPALGRAEGAMASFDLAALIFFAAIAPLFDDETREMRDAAARNDANRALLLGITGAVMLVVLVTVASELRQKQGPDGWSVALIVATLALAWTFSNLIYALHYAHMFYTQGKGAETGRDCGGLNFPETDEPDYWDFVYFSFTLGMTFQTSDVEMADGRFRRVAIFHCLAAFVFNLGVLAFTINVLGGGG